MKSLKWLAVVVALVLVTVVVGEALAQPGQGQGRRGPGVQGYGGRGMAMMVPGFRQLASPQVQEELELVPEQLEDLKKIGEEMMEEMRSNRPDFSNWREMSEEDRKEMREQMMERMRTMRDKYRAKAEEVLLPHQIDKLQDINFRTMAPYMLRSDRTLENLGITEDQKQELSDLRDEMTRRQQELQKEMAEKAMKVLSEEQVSKLKERIQSGGF